MKLRKFLSAVTVAAVALTSLSGCKGEPIKDDLTDAFESASAAETTAETVSAKPVEWLPDADIHNFIMPEIGEKIAVITVKDYGTIKIKLFPDDAPKGVENFVGLAEMGYYDELIFHRVIKDFMNQTGDPKGDGTGGKSIWGDKFEGGTSGHLYHFSGAVAYANSNGTSTNGSQFYIVNTQEDFLYCGGYYDENGELQIRTDIDAAGYKLPGNVREKYMEVGGTPMLDGGYTVFGQVFEGMDVVRAIGEAETNPENDKPLKQILMENVRIEEYQG